MAVLWVQVEGFGVSGRAHGLGIGREQKTTD